MPDWRATLRSRLAALHLPPAREAEILEELAQHLEDRWARLRAEGASDQRATAQALSEFDAARFADRLSGLRQAAWRDVPPVTSGSFLSIDALGFEIRQAWRSLRSVPSFTVGALAVLALGIGATTAIFSVVDAVVLRGLPFPDADRIVAVGERAMQQASAAGAAKSKSGDVGGAVGPKRKAVPMVPAHGPAGLVADPDALSRIEPQNYLDWVAGQQVFESIAARAPENDYTLHTSGADPEAVVTDRVTASFFTVLQVAPALGRLFDASAEVEGRDRLVVLSHAFWRRRFAADPAIVGRSIEVNDASYTVIGVMPPQFTYPVGAARPAEMWVPYVVPPNERVRGRGRSIYLESIARLRPDASLLAAQAQMDQLAAAIADANPSTNAERGIGVRPLRDHLVGANTRSWMLMMLAAVGIVFLIACTNVANLWLARASARERDIAVRTALGATRGQILRLFLVESTLVSLIGGVLGLALAAAGVRILQAAMPEDTARVADIALNGRVLTVAIIVSSFAGIVAGVAPGLRASRRTVAAVLSESARAGGAGGRRLMARRALVAAEVAAAFVLLAGASLFIQSFQKVMQLDLGFRPDHVISAQVYPGQQLSAPGASVDIGTALSEIAARLAHRTGVVAAAASAPGIPLRVNLNVDGLNVTGRVFSGDPSVSVKRVTPDYHQVLGIAILRGRAFQPTDNATSQPVIILSESAARTFFPDEDPLGRFVSLARTNDMTVVGVADDARQQRLETDSRPEVYVPLSQSGYRFGYVVVRTHDDPNAIVPEIRSAVASVLPQVPLRYVATMDALVDGQTATRRLNMLALSAFGVLGLVISAVGLFGVMAHLVTQRTREIGVRMALGASRGQVVAIIARHVVVVVGVGVVTGAAFAWWLASAARPFLFDLDPHDPFAFLTPVLVLVLAAVIASALPAWRAASVDPTIALRSE